MLITITIISIISSITLILPISYESHIFLLKNIFNTKIFDNNLFISSLNISLAIFFIFINIKNIPKLTKLSKEKKQSFNTIIKIIISTTLITLINLYIKKISINIKFICFTYFFTAFLLFLSTNKKGTKKLKDFSYFNSFCFPFLNILSIFQTIPPLCSNLLSSKILKLDKKTTLFYSTITIIPIYIIKSIPYIIKITNEKTLIYLSISILLNIILMFPIYKYFKNIYYKNKLCKLSIYLIILSTFLLFWFR